MRERVVRGNEPPDQMMVSSLKQLPRSRLERELWLAPRNKPFGGSRLDMVRVLVARANALLDELPRLPSGPRWYCALREGYVVLQNDRQERYHWNGGSPVLVEFDE